MDNIGEHKLRWELKNINVNNLSTDERINTRYCMELLTKGYFRGIDHVIHFDRRQQLT